MPETPPPETPPDPFVVTLRLDAALFGVLDAMRRQYFPPERNLIPAHVSLFHALPGAESAGVRRAIAAVAETTAPFPVAIATVRSLGRGVALDVDGMTTAPFRYGVPEPPGELQRVHARLVAAIRAQVGEGVLTPQDRQGFRPHVTVQNKVTPEVARETLRAVDRNLGFLTGTAEGIDLWRYRGGPWQHVKTYAFRRILAT